MTGFENWGEVNLFEVLPFTFKLGPRAPSPAMR
jgi:hypothetical protein